ncbi:hypothetical protein Tco_0895197 [Tanacetum coccineum]|uniref:Phosphoprotein n=1 Tax=Tanacetum coccineum TaxID=301880 RepID=A0ABQ5CDY9_9ASTR
MMTMMYEVFKGQSSGSVTPTLALTHIPANIEGENATNTATEEPPSHTKRETGEPKKAIPISTIQPNEVPPTQTQPITTIITHPEISQAAPRSDKGKGISIESDEDLSKRLVHASNIVHPDPNEEVKVPLMINGKMYYLTEKEMQAYLDKEEILRKVAEEERLLAISKHEVINVVQEEDEKIKLDPKKIASTKAGEKFKKAQEAEHQPEYGIFFTDEFDDQAFQRWSDIDKVGMEALVSYLVSASMVKSPENARFSMKLKKLIAEHPDQEKLKSNKVKLEALGYEMN